MNVCQAGLRRFAKFLCVFFPSEEKSWTITSKSYSFIIICITYKSASCDGFLLWRALIFSMSLGCFIYEYLFDVGDSTLKYKFLLLYLPLANLGRTVERKSG